MKKIKSSKIYQSNTLKGRGQKLDDGVMAIPTPLKERERSHAEMQEFIKRFKNQNDKP